MNKKSFSRAISQPPAARLFSKWLLLAQWVWILIAGLSLISLVLSVPLGYERLVVPCEGDNCASDQLGILAAENLAERGISTHFYALYNIGVTLTFSLAFFAVASLIFLRVPGDPMAWYVSLTLIVFGVYCTELVDGIRVIHPISSLWVDVMSSAGWILFAVMLYLFPDGRFLPSWTRWLAAAWVMTQLPYYIAPVSIFNIGTWPLLLQFPVYLFLFGAGIWSQVYRYRKISTSVQRQQTKWVLLGLSLAVLGILGLSILPEALAPELVAPGTPVNMLLDGMTLLLLLLLPLTLAAAVMRQRLWEIDLIINRALVYGILTMMLALLYFIGIVGLQKIFTSLMGVNQTPLLTVVTTLVTVTLFSPLRRRIQDTIDRRFYRRRYNAERALTALSSMLRNEVDTNMIVQQVMLIIDDTMQPASTSLWLKPKTNR